MPEIIKTKLVGVSQAEDEDEMPSRQQIIKKYVHKEDILLLFREPENEYDPNAIAAHVDIDYDDPWGYGDYKIGYLSSDLASRYAALIDAGGIITCSVLDVTGGVDKKNYGVNVVLGIYSPEEVAEYNRQKELKKANQITHSQPQPKPKPKQFTIHSQKNKIVAFLLCFFLGFFGAHYFYVKRYVFGLLYFFTFGLFGIGWIVDLIKILSGSFKDTDGNPLR